MSRKPKQQSIDDDDDQNSFPEINSDLEDTDDDSSYADENSDEENETEDDDQEEGEENILDQDQDSVQDSDQISDSDEEDPNYSSEEDAPNNESILVQSSDDEDDYEDDDDDYNDYVSESDSVGATNEKISHEMRKEILTKFHPELNVVSQEEIYDMCKVIRDKDDIIIDDNHKTVPILTKYEKTKILGIRAKQINNGAPPLIDIQVPSAGNRVGMVDTNETQVQKLQDKHFDGYLVALEELKQKLIPVIIRRPLPDGRSEYWPLKELEVFM